MDPFSSRLFLKLDKFTFPKIRLIFTVVDRLLLDQRNYLYWSRQRVVFIQTTYLICVFIEWNFLVVVIWEAILGFALFFTSGFVTTLLEFVKKLLGMRSDLGARPSSNNFLNFLPIFSVLHQAQHKSFMFLSGPSSTYFFRFDSAFVCLHF